MVKLAIVALFLIQLGCVLQAVQASHYIQFRASMTQLDWATHSAAVCIHDGNYRVSAQAKGFSRGTGEYKFDNMAYFTSVWWHSWGVTVHTWKYSSYFQHNKESAKQSILSGCWDTTDKICGTAKEEKAKRDCDWFMESYQDFIE